MMGFDADGWKKYQEHQESMAKLQFDRKELNTRAIGQMKPILTEDQLHRLGGLPDAQKDGEFKQW